MHAPAASPPLAPGDELVGRFRIERLIGAGGMGSVYLAFDRTLERQVAIKLHHTNAAARLLREAVAMAQLAHPNVIPVFEVGEVGEVAERAFVAMEYVPGSTLRAWLGAARRSWRDRVAVLVGAGRGLAAAHDAGLVHRDFKPENILVGDDGRPRVGDFGLARGSQSHDGDEPLVEAPPAIDNVLATPLTRTGAILGTPAYMAPEQARGRSVDARADQFAFCVVAWEALFGERPFAGGSTTELLAAIGDGPRARGRRHAAVRRVLARGLAAAPADRHADMRDLLVALQRATRSRIPLVLGAGALVAAAAVAFAVVALREPAATPPTCDAAGAEIDAAMPRDLAARVRAAGGPFADEGGARIAAAITEFAAGYRATARTACRAGRIEHAWSDELSTRARGCLEVRLRTASAMLATDRVVAADVPDLIEIANRLPVLEACTDPATLAAAPALPADARTFALEVAARAALDSAVVDLSLSRVATARATLARVANGPAAPLPAVAARILLVRAGVLRVDDQVAASERAYRDAYFAGRAIDDVEVTLPAITALVQSTGELREDHAAADDWIRTGLADAARARTRAPRAVSAVYAIAARSRLLEDDLAEAGRLAKLALALVADTRSLARADALALAAEVECATGAYPACYETEGQALALTRALLGPRHPRVAAVLAGMALDRPESSGQDALALAEEAKAIVDASRDLSNIDVARAETTLAVLIINTDVTARYGEARAMLEHARAQLVTALGTDHPDVAQIDSDLALLDNADGKLADGAARLRSALAIQEHALGPNAARVADTLYNLAATLRDLHAYGEALAAAQRAVAINAATRPNTMRHAVSLGMAAAVANLAGDAPHALDLAERVLAMEVAKPAVFAHAWAAMEAARALLALHRTPARARALLEEAKAVFGTLGLEPRVAEVTSLLARVPR